VIALAALWVYWPIRHGQWIGDDALYITSNPLMHDPARLWKAWFQPGSFIEYYPIEESIQWMQWQLWHNDTFGYHLTNIALHVINALLVWRLFAKFGLRLAWLGGLIFAVHPMMVDSAAVVNELKTVLSMTPFLLAMCFYIDYEQYGRRRDYWLAVGLFAAAMLCKITMAMFPVAILLFVWWKRGRIGRRDLAASAPFFAISLVLGLTTIWVGESYRQFHYMNPEVNQAALGGPFSRLALVGQIILFYFSRCFLPITPLPMYPQWRVDPASPLQFLPWLIMAATFYYLWTKRKSWGRHALLGLGFFVIMLAPFLGANWISYMIVTWVLEHLLYIPILGLIGLVIAGSEQIYQQLPQPCRPLAIGIVAAAIALLAFQSRAYANRYINDETLCAYTVMHYPGDFLAHNNLGLALGKRGLIDESIVQYREALAANPKYQIAHYNLGLGLIQKGDFDAAVVELKQALLLSPDDFLVRTSLGNALQAKGQLREAINEYQKVVALKPGFAPFHYNLGKALSQASRQDEAIAQYQIALALDPTYAEAQNGWGVVLAEKGDIPQATTHFQEALRLKPDLAEAQTNLTKAQALLHPSPPPQGK